MSEGEAGPRWQSVRQVAWLTDPTASEDSLLSVSHFFLGTFVLYTLLLVSGFYMGVGDWNSCPHARGEFFTHSPLSPAFIPM